MSETNAKAQGKEGGGVEFVDYVPGEKVTTAKGVPRLAHRKSRTGCQRCRARRVKVCLSPTFLCAFALVK